MAGIWQGSLSPTLARNTLLAPAVCGFGSSQVIFISMENSLMEGFLSVTLSPSNTFCPDGLLGFQPRLWPILFREILGQNCPSSDQSPASPLPGCCCLRAISPPPAWAPQVILKKKQKIPLVWCLWVSPEASVDLLKSSL